MKQFNSLLLLLLVFVFYSCSPKPAVPETIPVAVKSPKEEVTVYVNETRAGRGKTVIAKVLKDESLKTIRFERPGFKDAFDVLILDKVSPLQARPAKMIEIPQRDSGQKYIQLTELLNDLPVGKIEREIGQLDARRQEIKKETWNPDLNMSNALQGLEKYMPNTGFLSREGRLMQTPSNTLFTKARLADINIIVEYFLEGKQGTEYFIRVEPSISWTSYDAYGNRLHERTIRSYSGNFPVGKTLEGPDYNRGLQQAFEDGLIAGFLQYLASKQLVPMLKLPEIVPGTYPRMTLLNTKNTVKNVDDARKATVQLVTETGKGYGFMISDDGWILTALHLIQDAENPDVILYDNSLLATKLIRKNEQLDLALLKAEGWDNPSFSIPDDTGYPVGQNVMSLDASGRIQNVIPIESSDYNWLLTNLAIKPGNEGGPVFTKGGQLIGMVVQQLDRPTLGASVFVFPVDEAARLLSVQQLSD